MEVSESCHFYLYQNIFLFLFRGFFYMDCVGKRPRGFVDRTIWTGM